jgi:hypothetical protein
MGDRKANFTVAYQFGRSDTGVGNANFKMAD